MNYINTKRAFYFYISIVIIFIMNFIINSKIINRTNIENKYLKNEIKELKEFIQNDEVKVNKELEETNIGLIRNNNELRKLLNDSAQYDIELISYIKEYNKELYYELYINILNKYKLNIPNNLYDDFSENEILYMQKCIETETYQCSFDAKVNVASVILNRIKHESFPNNAVDVVTSPKQFCYIRNNISQDTITALEYAYLFNGDFENAVYFQSSGYKETFNGAEYVGTDGYHWFYK